MGKKKKSIENSFWEITEEEQMKAADDFYAVQTKKKSIFDLGEVDNAPLNDNGLSEDLEKLVLSDLSGIHYKEEYEVSPSKKMIPDYNDFIKQREKPKKMDVIPDVIPDVRPVMKNTEEKVEREVLPKDNKEETLAKFILNNVYESIKFEHKKFLDKIIISDPVGTTMFAVDTLEYIDIDETSWDPDELGGILTQLYYYILSCKHPIAILTKDEFARKFRDIKSVDPDKFVFYAYDEYIFMYYIDTDHCRDELMDAVEYYNLSDENTLKYYIGIAYSVGETNYIFKYDDPQYLSEYMSKYNNTDTFLHLIADDKNTKLIEEEPTDDQQTILRRLNVINIASIQQMTRESINKLIGDDYDDEDDEYDETDEEPIDNDTETTEVSENNNTEESVDEPLTIENSEDIDIEIPDDEEKQVF